MQRAVYIVIIVLTIVIIMVIHSENRNEIMGNRIIAWTEFSENNDGYTCIYSTSEKRIIEKIPGILIPTITKDRLMCYERKEGTITLFEINDQWVRIPIADMDVPDRAEVIAWHNGTLYYVLDDTLMRCSEAGLCADITTLKGDFNRTSPQPVNGGKWAYSYRDSDTWKIDILTETWDVITTFEGLYPVWYDEEHLLFRPSLSERGLYLYDCINGSYRPMCDDMGHKIETKYTLFYTDGISIDRNHDFLTYSMMKDQRILAFQTDMPQNLVVVVLNMHTGRETTIDIPPNQSLVVENPVCFDMQ